MEARLRKKFSWGLGAEAEVDAERTSPTLQALNPHLLQHPEAIDLLTGNDLKPADQEPLFVIPFDSQDGPALLVDPDTGHAIECFVGGCLKVYFPGGAGFDRLLSLNDRMRPVKESKREILISHSGIADLIVPVCRGNRFGHAIHTLTELCLGGSHFEENDLLGIFEFITHDMILERDNERSG